MGGVSPILVLDGLYQLIVHFVIVKEFGNRPFIFQDDNATPHVSRQTSTWKIENGFPKMIHLHDLHNLRTLTLSKMSGAVSKSNFSVKLTKLKNDKI